MVRCALVGAVLVVFGTGAASAAPSWRTAGGDLFVGEAASDTPAGVGTANADSVRLAAPDQPYAAAVETAAQAHGLDPKLLHAVVIVESAYRTKAVSPAGAAGLTQLMPATASALGVRDRFDPAANLLGGANYLAGLLAKFGDLRLALAAYNAGPGRVAALGHVPNIAETRAYVSAVVNCYLALAAGRSLRSSNECRSPEVAP
jgi:soluble lytic murein transglycosylase-like protein